LICFNIILIYAWVFQMVSFPQVAPWSTLYTYACIYICVCVWVKCEVQNPTQWAMNGCSMTALLPVLSPSSNLPPPLSYCAFIPARKNSARFWMLLNFFT
jgi:hypothetical protein